jgi:hypothetical protein
MLDGCSGYVLIQQIALCGLSVSDFYLISRKCVATRIDYFLPISIVPFLRFLRFTGGKSSTDFNRSILTILTLYRG